MQQFKNKKYVQIRSGCSSYLSTCCAWTGGGAAEPPPLPWALLLRPAGGWVDVGEEPLPEVFCGVFGAGTPNSTCNMILAKYEEGSSFKIVAMVRSRLLFGKQRMERKKGNEVTNVVW